MNTPPSWYSIANIDTVDSPALVVYPERVRENIKTLLASIDSVDRLRPHVKTHKSSEVTQMMLAAGIRKFKCATIAEAEMLALAGAPDVLLAYQPIGPKAERFASLIKQHPSTSFSCLVDNPETASALAALFAKMHQTVTVYVDVNVGMNRTGVVPEKAPLIFDCCEGLDAIRIAGFHAYDGHIRDTDMDVRKRQCDEGFFKVEALRAAMQEKFQRPLIIIAGGTPTFSIHSKRKEIECSPGTYIYWDKGYEQTLQEQHYLHAALVVTRIISLPSNDTICIDLGHKAIASENPLPKRVYFLNAPDLEPVGHSEEHMVFKVPSNHTYKVGDVFYGVPYHVCPTVALHDRVAVAEDHRVTTYWNTLSRNRTITI